MGDSLKQQFDAIAKEYDQQRKHLIPCFDDFYGVARATVEWGSDSPNILDLGAGTGLFSAFVMQKYPQARFTLIDLSENMIEMARSRFGDAENVQYVIGDYTKLPQTDRFDIVISSLSIHHLSHADKRELFRSIYETLPDGGIFVNADQALGSTPFIDSFYKTKWDESVYKSGLSAEAIDASKERRKLDNNAHLVDQLAWLREAGFTDVDCVYKYFDFAVFFAKK